MKVLFKGILLGLFFVIYALPRVSAQPIPVGDIQEEQYRLLQLLSDSTVDITMNNRPVWQSTYRQMLNRQEIRLHANSWWAHDLTGYEKKVNGNWRLGVFTPLLTNTVNSDLPYGGNNGAAWYGRGLTTELQGGGYISSKYVTVTFRPHLIYTQNSDFPVPRFIPRDAQGNPRYTAIFPGIDMPYRFGPDSYTDFNLGQTSLRLHYKNIEGGLSNETLWWGPGIQNALALSNNAPGLRHAFLGTRAPLSLPLGIGDLEFKFIWAEPQDSEYFGSTDRQRFTAGLNMIFSPGFAPNLSLGFTRFSHRFIPEGGLTLDDFAATLPIVNKRQNQNSGGGSDAQNQMVSVYFRWVFPESNAEVYAEYYREDSYFDGRDLFFEPDHDRAYTVGFQKVVETSGWFDIFKLNAEINSLVPSRVGEVRPQTYYYRHNEIRQGHTNEGQVLGAAIGPGSASQFFGVDGYFDKGMLGIFVQRVAENDFFHYEYYDVPRFNDTGIGGPTDIYRHRVNLNIGMNGYYKIGPLLFGGKLVWNKNFNYGRYNYGELEGINFDTVDKNDIVNIHFQLSARYYFNNL